jgi:predicted nucleic acid-binding protein
MKNRDLLIDTNIILDWILDRQPFAKASKNVMELCIKNVLCGYLAAHTILNIFYIIRKDKSVSERKEIHLMLCDSFEIIDVEKPMIVEALENEKWQDLEDGLQMLCAAQQKLDYIITRNIKDFTNSKIEALSPEDFLQILETKE